MAAKKQVLFPSSVRRVRTSREVLAAPSRRLFLNEESSAEQTPTKEKKILRAKVVAYKLDPELSEVLLSYQVSATPGKFRNFSYQTSFDRRGVVFGILDPTVRETSAVASADRSSPSLCISRLKSTHLVLECDLPTLSEASLAHLQSYTASEKLQRGLRMISRIDILCETTAMRRRPIQKVTL